MAPPLMPEDFRNALFAWHKIIQRPMPWKGEKNPYRIWLSEIILQQTRVEQGWSYYEKFIAAFPDLAALSAADENAVLKLWEGLGYYSRARNLLRCAQVVQQRFGGTFPETVPQLLQLPGIGPYTAAAIASFAFNAPVAAIDGNVERILARLWGIETPIDLPEGKKLIADLANTLLDPAHPGLFNQAMMDFGAVQCLPRNPLCGQCPFRNSCTALHTEKTALLPVKSKKITKKIRCFHYLILRRENEVFIRQRPKGDVWTALWEFPLIEHTSPDLSLDELRSLSTLLQIPQQTVFQYCSGIYRQTLTHQQIVARFWTFQIPKELPAQIDWNMLHPIPWEKLRTCALPGIIRSYLEDKNLSLVFQ